MKSFLTTYDPKTGVTLVHLISDEDRLVFARMMASHEELLQLLRIARAELNRDVTNKGLIPVIEKAITKAEGKS